MRQNAPNIAAFAVLAAALTAGWWYVDKTYFPPPVPKPPREALLALTGVGPTLVPPAGDPAAGWPLRTRPIRIVDAPKPADPTAGPAAAPPPPPPSNDPPTLVVLGGDAPGESFKRVVLTTRGGAVQQVVVNTFEEANALGKEVKRDDGSPQRMHLIPGVVRDRYPGYLTDLRNNPALGRIPTLPAGVAAEDVRKTLAEPSYVVLHYPAKDDPARLPDDARAMNNAHPSPDLGDRHWKLAESGRGDDGVWKAAFETDLGAPYHLRLRKTYTLGPKDYHVGLRFDVTALPARVPGSGAAFRYQIAGGRGLPVEGEWYATTFRNAMAGWRTPEDAVRRSFEDAGSVFVQHGGDRVPRAGNTFDYAAVATQYFASAVAIDDTMPAAERTGLWDHVRPTREPSPADTTGQQFLTDITVRAVAAPVDPKPGESVTHSYLLYNGPVKVGLLRQLDGDKAVAPELVDRYANKLNLRTMTDYHSPHFFGRLASMVWWSDVVIFFTNLMHSVLGFLNGLVPVWGLNVIMLTVMVRLMLFGPSRRQQAAMAKLQARMAQLKPEIDKLHEKYKDDYHAFNQAKTKLMLEHGVNPFSTMGGCFLLFAQMPVLMGLYFCLQESVFFRLEPFLWVPNLAAPDMLVWWTENVPFVSTPDNVHGAIYLGPYLNILPIVSVVLIFIHQMKTLPPPTDEQQEMQQKMMKIMVVMMAVFFYKVPAGLCIYFICGTLWALAERQFIPKPTAGPLSPPTDKGDGGSKGGGPKPAPAAPPGGGLMGKLRAKMEELQRQAEEQSKRQVRNAPPPDAGGDRGGRRDRKKKRK